MAAPPGHRGHLSIPIPIPLPLPIPDPFSGGVSHLVHRISSGVVNMWFGEVVHFVSRGDIWLAKLVWKSVSATTQPVLSGSSFHAEFSVMAVLGASVALPLLAAAAIQAVVRQDAGGLVRTALIRLPLALLFTGVAVEIVSLGLSATDQACSALIASSGHSVHAFVLRLVGALLTLGPGGAFGSFLLMLLAGLAAMAVWLELALRSAAIAVAALFLPLALAGSAYPATAHWARRLGETLAALVLSKLVIVAVLVLAVSTFAGGGGISAVVEGTALFALASLAPFAVLRLLPMLEGGAISHLEGVSRRPAQAARRLASTGSAGSWMSGSAAGMDVGGQSAGHGVRDRPQSHPAGSAVAQSTAATAGSSGAGSPSTGGSAPSPGSPSPGTSSPGSPSHGPPSPGPSAPGSPATPGPPGSYPSAPSWPPRRSGTADPSGAPPG
ncbi:MAG: hypothetical protein ACRDZP_01250 [Acidimicrobiales bacterium]